MDLDELYKLSIYLYVYLFLAKDLDEMDLDELYKLSIYLYAYMH